MATNHQAVQGRLRSRERFNYFDIVKDAWGRSVADYSFYVFETDTVNDGLHGVTSSGRIQQINLVSTLKRNPRSGG
jgi:hypothetical protein